ncbi:MAG: site-specific integrase [Phycisphaerales bacterium]
MRRKVVERPAPTDAGIQGRTATGSCASNAAGERVDFHALRTTCGTMLANAGVPVMHLKRMMRHANIAMTDRHYTKLRTMDLRAGLERALEKPVALAATGTETLTPKLTPTTATNGVFRGATASNGPTRIGAARRAASGLRSGVYALSGASKDDGVQHPSNYGPVAQRPRAIDS